MAHPQDKSGVDSVIRVQGLVTGFGRKVAMHVAATNPLALDSTSLDKETVARERAILAEKHQGKPANVIDKIVESGLKTYYKEVCLIDQPFVHDTTKTVGQAVQEFANAIKQPIRVAGFVRFALGEGIDKGEGGDFAGEVAARAALVRRRRQILGLVDQRVVGLAFLDHDRVSSVAQRAKLKRRSPCSFRRAPASPARRPVAPEAPRFPPGPGRCRRARPPRPDSASPGARALGSGGPRSAAVPV